MEVKIAEFKAHLSAHLRAVRKGSEITIKDRDTPIARVVPYQAPALGLVTRRPTRSLKEVDRLPPKKFKNLKPGDLETAYRETRMDFFDKWLAGRFT
jgi:prevent-host-death family protein